MGWMHLLSGLVGAGLLVYLVVVLLKAESF